MFAGCKPRMLPMLEPDVVAKRIVTAIKTNEVTVVMPRAARYLLPLKRYVQSNTISTALVSKRTLLVKILNKSLYSTDSLIKCTTNVKVTKQI